MPPGETAVSGIDLSTCDREPIHIPGCIQPHGVLLTLAERDLKILQISENANALLGVAPAQLLGSSVADLVDAGARAAFIKRLRDEDVSYSNPMQVVIPVAGGRRFDGLVHRQGDLLLLELENPRPLTAGNGDSDVPGAFYVRLVRAAVSKLHAARGLQQACDVLAAEVRRFSGFDRVMVYRFAADGHGQVIAEAMADGQETYLGLHYPATDIPQQARRLYCLNWLRLIVDVNYRPARLLPELDPLSGAPLDLSHAVLRSVSPVHIQYLKNMGIGASMSISLLNDEDLWGLIACHHRSPKFVAFEGRAACELLAMIMSSLLTAKEQGENAKYESGLQAVRAELLRAVAGAGSVLALAEDGEKLLQLADAAGAAVLFNGEKRLVGRTPDGDQIDALLDWLKTRAETELYHTDCLAAHYPPAAAFTAVASGLLAVALSHAQGDYVLFFRPEAIHTVNWAGDPAKAVTLSDDGEEILTPRQSFALWKETVRQKALPWLSVQIEIAGGLRNALVTYLVQRAKELAELNRELERSNIELDAFAYIASHDLKEPLRGIYGYAYYLEEHCAEVLDETAQGKVAGLMRLARRMDDLLDSLLHYSRVGRTELALEETDLNEVLAEALDMISVRRQELGVEIRVPRPLPALRCDRMRVREVFTNLISNAFKYNDKDERWVEVGYIAPAETGPVRFYIRDNGLGIRQRHHKRVFEMFKRLHGRDEFGGGTGVGLPIIKKIIERHNGKIWLESVPGEGATFYFTLEAETS